MEGCYVCVFVLGGVAWLLDEIPKGVKKKINKVEFVSLGGVKVQSLDAGTSEPLGNRWQLPSLAGLFILDRRC